MCKLIAFSCVLVLVAYSTSTSPASTPLSNDRSMAGEINANSGMATDLNDGHEDDPQIAMPDEGAVLVPPAAPMPDPAGLTKNRFISFEISQPGIVALKVTLVSLHHVDPAYASGTTIPFTQFEGQSLYVGPPTRYIESLASAQPFYSSTLQCEPHYQDWSTIGLLHVTGEAVVPSSIYDIQSLSDNCLDHEDDCPTISVALTLETTRWGDVVGFNDVSADGYPDFADVSALVDKFKDAPGAPIKSAALLAGLTERGSVSPGSDLDMTHVSVVVNAFKGSPYPHKPGRCSNNSARSCISDDECSDDGLPGSCQLCGDVTGGACCHGDGTCDIMPESACNGAEDIFHGDGTPCSRCCGPSADCLPLTDAEWLKAQQSWPKLNREDVCKEAGGSHLYNCVGWVLGSTNQLIWIGLAVVVDDEVWPLSEFEEFIDPYQKPVIVYGTDDGSVLHTAIPLPNNCASSKAGPWIRIRHDRNQLEGGGYGNILTTYIY